MPRPPLDLLGQTFNHLTALERIGGSEWQLKCVCGNLIVATASRVVSGKIISCGCIRQSKIRSEHRVRRTDDFLDESTYNSYNAMMQRCNNTKNHNYPRYGGRGIMVCPEWKSNFVNFKRDMGIKPTAKHTIERINNEGNYEPSNCRWATMKEQAQNRRCFHPEY